MNWKNKIICMVLAVMILLPVLTQETTIYAAEHNILPSGVKKEELEQQINRFVVEHEDTTAGMAVAVFDSTDELLKDYYVILIRRIKFRQIKTLCLNGGRQQSF